MSHHKLVISCEHGGKEVPPSLRDRFQDQESLLDSHRGWDPGALYVAKHFSETLAVPLVYQTISRLVIECNRTQWHPQLFSELTSSLTPTEKAHWLNQLYYPYREALQKALHDRMAQYGRALHLSSHTMGAEVDGVVRPMDVALLFHPGRPSEVALCEAWKHRLSIIRPDLLLAFNKPFLGNNDGQVTWLRSMYTDEVYTGIELELNQKWVGTPEWDALVAAVRQSFTEAMKDLDWS